jgi:hypothetical protein
MTLRTLLTALIAVAAAIAISALPCLLDVCPR